MTTTDLVKTLIQKRIRLQVCDDQLRYYPRSAMTRELFNDLSANKAKLLRLLSDLYDSSDDDWENDESVNWSSLLELTECPVCGSLICWWDIRGGQHCMACDPPHKAISLMEEAEGIRERLGLPSPPGVKEHLAGLQDAVRSETRIPSVATNDPIERQVMLTTSTTANDA